MDANHANVVAGGDGVAGASSGRLSEEEVDLRSEVQSNTNSSGPCKLFQWARDAGTKRKADVDEMEASSG